MWISLCPISRFKDIGISIREALARTCAAVSIFSHYNINKYQITLITVDRFSVMTIAVIEVLSAAVKVNAIFINFVITEYNRM
jgi:hypothetical protein